MEPDRIEPTTRRSTLMLGLSATLCAVTFIGLVHWRPAQFQVLAEIKTDAPARFELRYNRGYGSRHEGIATTIVEKTGEFIRVRFPIDVNSAYGLRLVTVGFGRALDIRSRPRRPLGGPPRNIVAAELAPNVPNEAETRISQVGDTIHVDSNGTDPLVLHFELNSRIPATPLAALWQWILVVLLAVAVLWVIMALRSLHLVRRDDPSPGAAAWFKGRQARKVVVIALGLLYFIVSLFGLNGSSTSLWRAYADREMPMAGVLLGSPKEVRSDEWLIQTPWVFSQASRTPAFSASNPSIGSDVTPLVTNLPVHHWSTWFRPQMWPFFFLSPERAFSFSWNFKTFGLLLSAFLFFGLLTGGKTLLDLAGALFLTFSPFIQWWLSTPTCLPEMLAMILLVLWLVAVVGRAQLRWLVALAALGLLGAIENFIFCCYPRFQIPLVYLAAALSLAIFAGSKRTDDLRKFRICCLGLTVLLVTFVTWQWWRDVAEIVRITSLLSYPGQIRFKGGGFEWRRFFDPFLEFSMTGDRFPERLENASEAAGFLFLAPVFAACAIGDAIRGKVDRMLVVPLLLITFAVVYMTAGIPVWLATISGWSHVSPVRVQLLVGLATSFLLVRWLARGEERQPSPTSPWLVFAASFLLLFPILRLTNVGLGHFATPGVVVATAVFFGLVVVCLWQRSVVAACLLLVIPQFYACALVNPIAQGVPAITESRMFHWLAKTRENKPDGNWIVLGNTLRAQLFPEFIKSTGADVLGGVRCHPDYPMLRILDPAGKYRALTDRYAWIH